MNPPTIAICISGQVRSSNQALLAIAKEARSIDADVFISVWSKRGGKTFEGAVGPKNIRRIIGESGAQLLPDSWLGRMRNIFPESGRFFPKKEPITREDLEAIFPDAIVEVENDSTGFDFEYSDSNSLRMLYKIWRANHLKKKRELELGAKYDRVVRVRPDMLFNGRALQNLQIKPNSVFVQGHAGNRKNYLNDTIWLTSSQNDDALSALYDQCVAAKEKGWKGIHRELSDIAAKANLVPIAEKMIKRGISDFGTESSQLLFSTRDKLLNAVATLELNTDRAGGTEFCRLVSIVVKKAFNSDNTNRVPKIDSQVFSQLAEVERHNRNSYFQAIIYLSNVCMLDASIPANDRIELMFRVISHYFLNDAFVFLDVKILELPEMFASSPVALFNGISLHVGDRQPLQTETARVLCEKWDLLSPVQTGTELENLREKISEVVLKNGKFVIDLHRKLTKINEHNRACNLANFWIENSPEVWRGYVLKAESEEALGLLNSALITLYSAEERAQPHTRVQELKGRMFVKLGQYDEARVAFKKSVSLPGCNENRVFALLKNLETISG